VAINKLFVFGFVICCGIISRKKINKDMAYDCFNQQLDSLVGSHID
tara:strand:- start:4853 stop:4990 length:138 start_codon:yes stop_codon:yes gene_type:complete